MDSPALSVRFSRFCVAAVAFWCALRFFELGGSPPGFYIDEATAALNAICTREAGTGFMGDRHPLFVENLGGATTSPPFRYLEAGWTWLFGNRPESLRGMVALFSVLSIAFFFLLAQTLLGRSFAAFATLIYAASPQCFHFARVAWDSGLQNTFLLAGLYFLLRPAHRAAGIAAGFLLGIAMYCYGAARLQVPLLVVGLLCIPSLRQRIGARRLGEAAVAGALTLLPLVAFTLFGRGLNRMGQVGLFAPGYLSEVGVSGAFKKFFANIVDYFRPSYLFARGDFNLRHSTRFFGVLGWLDVLGLACGLAVLWRRRGSGNPETPVPSRDGVPTFAILGILTGLLPGILTWDSIPHALRATGAVPFYSLLTGWCLWQAWKVRPRLVVRTCAVLTMLYTVVFARIYFVEYRNAAVREGWFDSEVVDAAYAAGLTGEWQSFFARHSGYHEAGLRYLLVAYGKQSCQSSQKMVDRMLVTVDGEVTKPLGPPAPDRCASYLATPVSP